MPSVPSRHAFRPLRIGGLQAMTTLDYPDHLACVLFCQGCAWRCRYCHNPELIRAKVPTPITWDEVLRFLRKRRGLRATERAFALLNYHLQDLTIYQMILLSFLKLCNHK